MNLKLSIQLLRNMGGRYVAYRVKHELEKKLGLLRKRHPFNLGVSSTVSLAEWKALVGQAPIISRENLTKGDETLDDLKLKTEGILNGKFSFFNATQISLGKDYNWITNPLNGYVYDIHKHWSDIPDLSEEAGDIKYVWEKSRFSWLLTLIRYDYHFGKDLSEFVFSEIESWIEHNPINRGPNWRCSQETSLRIFNWYFALTYYADSSALTEARWKKILDVIYASLHHVYHHIDFSRIAVRNNHAITETLFLALSDIFFPFISETKLWAKEGRRWFEEEIAYQIYEDGTFLQFSMNYHRVVIQLLTLGITVTERVGRPFSDVVYDRAYKSLEFLYQCLQEENGWLPNYGSNDGALFFPWSDTDYRDYRPQLNSLHKVLTGGSLYDNRKYTEELDWWNVSSTAAARYHSIKKFEGIKEYPIGGYVIIRDTNTFTFLRCGSHKDRPAQADNLHMDIWVDGKNVLRDSGSYKYNTTPEYLNYFMGTASHNAVVVDEKSQMLKGGRFIWYYWTQKERCTTTETEEAYVFEGVIKAYQFLNERACLMRTVKKMKNEPRWIVTDAVLGLDSFAKKQVWHLDDHQVEFRAKEDEIPIESQEVLSYNSDYYGVIEDGKGIAFKFKQKIETELVVK